MAALNKIIIIGRLTHDPELRYTQAGHPVASFTVAVDRKYGREDETDFIPVVAWRRLAEICNEFLHKGKLVAVEGRLQVRSYEDKEGRRQRAFEVVADDMQMLDSKGGGATSGRDTQRQASPREQSSGSGGFPPQDDTLGIDDIPF